MIERAARIGHAVVENRAQLGVQRAQGVVVALGQPDQARIELGDLGPLTGGARDLGQRDQRGAMPRIVRQRAAVGVGGAGGIGKPRPGQLGQTNLDVALGRRIAGLPDGVLEQAGQLVPGLARRQQGVERADRARMRGAGLERAAVGGGRAGDVAELPAPQLAGRELEIGAPLGRKRRLGLGLERERVRLRVAGVALDSAERPQGRQVLRHFL